MESPQEALMSITASSPKSSALFRARYGMTVEELQSHIRSANAKGCGLKYEKGLVQINEESTNSRNLANRRMDNFLINNLWLHEVPFRKHEGCCELIVGLNFCKEPVCSGEFVRIKEDDFSNKCKQIVKIYNANE